MGFCAFVKAMDGTPLMPITDPKRFRELRDTKAFEIISKKPLTVKFNRPTSGMDTQPVELCMDAGSEHVGISVKSEAHEYVHAQYDLLSDEKEHHDDCRKYRHARRNRKRYRQPRFNNRSKKNKQMAPSIRNKEDQHIRLYKKYKDITPITSVTVEVGSFDTQALEAQEKGLPLPSGVDYQRGPMFEHDNRREAVFYRDKHTCLCCGSTIGKKKMPDGKYKPATVILRMHHLGFRNGDHSDRLANLATVCTWCHTSSNHKPGGKLWDFKPKIKPLTGAAFMNIVRYKIIEDIKAVDPNVEVHRTFGSVTKRTRLTLDIEKTHANDAYCMGKLRPRHRTQEKAYQKVRRNDRVLQRFYDAQYVDIRDGKVKPGGKLSCNRIKRSEPRISDKNERIYRGEKVKEGYFSIRRRRAQIKAGSLVEFDGEVMTVYGTHKNYKKNTTNVEFTKPAKNGRKSAYLDKVTVIRQERIYSWVLQKAHNKKKKKESDNSHTV